MANMVLTVSGGKKSKSSAEIYKDISMNSKFVPALRQPDPTDYMDFLCTEFGFTASEVQLITTNEEAYRAIVTKFDDISYEEAVKRYDIWKSKVKYTVDRLVNVKAVQNSLHQIFSWIPGERILNPEFGSTIQKYLYEGITQQNIEAIMAEIRHCVTEWEPRVIVDKVVNVQSADDTENNTVRLDIYYHIKGLTDEQFVYSYNYYKHFV